MTESDNWQLKCLKINQRGNVLLESEQWADCTFLVGEEGEEQVRFQCHTLLLSMASPVFEAMFYGRMAERKQIKPLIKILDIHPDVFKLLLLYIYTDTLDMTSSSWVNVCGLWYAAKKYMLPHLETTCIEHLSTNIEPDNVCGIYEYVNLFEESTLAEKCITTMNKCTKEVLSSKSFLEAKLTTVVTLFSMDALTSTELELFEAAERYHKAQKLRETDSDNNQNVKNDEEATVERVSDQGECNIRSALEKIHFLTLTAEQFATGPANSTLLTESECYAIIMNIVTATSKVPLPKGFSTLRSLTCN